MVTIVIKVFCLENCPHCDMIKNFFKENNISFKSIYADTAEGITELRVEGCFEIEMPVVFIITDDGIDIFTHNDMFPNGNLNKEVLQWMGSYQ